MTILDTRLSALPPASLHSISTGAAGFSDPELQLPDEWQWVPLGALAEFVNGDRSENYPTQADRVPRGIPFINTGHIEENGRLTTLGMDYITRESFDRLRNGKVQCGDILYCLRGSTIGKTARNHFSEGAIASSLVIVRANKHAHQDYLYFYLISPIGKQLVAQHDNGSAQPNLSVRVLANYPVPLPPANQQRAIARILGALDDKIELNRKMNATLEAMARALFKSWFVDFDPVRAKAEGRTPSGTDAETAKLFPSEFVESELGPIPKGWTLRAVGDLAVLSGGKQLERALIFDDGTIPVFGGAGVMGFTAGHNADGFVISVGRVGAYCGQFFAHRGKAWINNNASLIRPKNEHIAEWMFIALKHADIEVIKKGAAQPFVSNGDIADLKLLWPGESTVAAFSSQLVPLLSAKDMNDAESKKLTRIRDELLPLLLSGELSVDAAEREVEAVA